MLPIGFFFLIKPKTTRTTVFNRGYVICIDSISLFPFVNFLMYTNEKYVHFLSSYIMQYNI